jgi:3',5'-cyclic AMP phosphodiesterase CpdA
MRKMRQRVKAIGPDLVVVSGDLTQRAKAWQFREAKAFLDSLPKPQVVVPGNHDIPLYNVFQRFFAPLDKFRRFVGNDLEPEYIDDEIAVIGINTARSATWKDGKINKEQVEKVRAKICRLPDSVAKIVVTHHPFDVPADHDGDEIVDRAKKAMKVFAECGADMLLSGHLHKTHTGHTAERYKIPGHSALIVQAGTATSTRARGESNSFNALHVTPDGVAVERYEWQPDARDFILRSTERFRHAPDGWHPK